MLDHIVNNAGYEKIEYIPIGDIAAITINTSTFTATALTLKPGKSWTEIYCIKYGLKSLANLESDDNGLYYKVAIEGSIPTNTPVTNSITNPLLIPFQRYAIKLTDFDGNMILAGTKTEGLVFSLRKNQEGHPGSPVGILYGFDGPLSLNSLLFLS